MINESRGSSTKQTRSYLHDDENEEILSDLATEAMVAEGCPNDDVVVLQHLRHENDEKSESQ